MRVRVYHYRCCGAAVEFRARKKLRVVVRDGRKSIAGPAVFDPFAVIAGRRRLPRRYGRLIDVPYFTFLDSFERSSMSFSRYPLNISIAETFRYYNAPPPLVRLFVVTVYGLSTQMFNSYFIYTVVFGTSETVRRSTRGL